jgi:hypothetical protein
MNPIDPAQVYKKLLNSMPSIGFINRNKRIQAYITVTDLAQKMIDAEEITEDEALFILSLMAKKSHSFRKATTMTILSLETLNKGTIKTVGFKYANEMRCNMRLPPVDESAED